MGESVLSTFLRYTEMWNSPLSTLSIILAVVLGGGILLWVQRSYTLHSCRRPDAVLPKGSLGWPIVGELLDLKYGSTFKTNIFLHPTICATTPEFLKFIHNSSHLFQRAFPESFKQIIGPTTFIFQEGSPHLSVRKLVLTSVGPEGLGHQVHMFEKVILEHTASWVRAGTVVARDATQTLTWDASNCILFGDKNTASSPQGSKNLKNFKTTFEAIAALPVDLPGTPYSNSKKVRELSDV